MEKVGVSSRVLSRPETSARAAILDGRRQRELSGESSPPVVTDQLEAAAW
jgi:hypothetical protein